MEILYIIPTYKRVDKQDTLKLLVSCGIKKENILLQTQCEEDYNGIINKYSDICNVYYNECDSVSKTRNNALKNSNDRKYILMMDDDITSFYTLKQKKLQKIENEELQKMFESFFLYTENNNGKMWGIYPCKNASFMSNNIDKKSLICSVLGIINDDYIKFNESFKAKEDIELCCRIMKYGFNIIRFNFITCNVKHYQKGGCYDMWKTQENKRCAYMLLNMYPKLLKRNPRREGEVLFNGKRR